MIIGIGWLRGERILILNEVLKGEKEEIFFSIIRFKGNIFITFEAYKPPK
jgi:hypothetical protein